MRRIKGVKGDETYIDLEPTWGVEDSFVDIALPTNRNTDPGELDDERSAIAQYLHEIRKYSLLTPREEKNLWVRIEHTAHRVRRALHFSLVALPVLTGLLEKLRARTVTLDEIVNAEDSMSSGDSALLFGEQIATVSQIANELQALRRCYSDAGLARSTRRQLRIEHRDLLRKYSKEWAALRLRPVVYETIRKALEQEPTTMSLQHATRALAKQESRLEGLKTEMLHANLRLAVHVAKIFRGRGGSF